MNIFIRVNGNDFIMENFLFNIGQNETHEINIKLRPLLGHIIVFVDGDQFWESSFLKFESPVLKIGKTEVNEVLVKFPYNNSYTRNFYQWKILFKKAIKLFKILGFDVIFSILMLWSCWWNRATTPFVPESDSTQSDTWRIFFDYYNWTAI